MVVALLLIIAGVLLMATGIGAVLGLPMIIIGIIMMLFGGAKAVGRAALPRSNPAYDGAANSAIRGISVLAILLAIGIAYAATHGGR